MPNYDRSERVGYQQVNLVISNDVKSRSRLLGGQDIVAVGQLSLEHREVLLLVGLEVARRVLKKVLRV